jgi:hypothetical protein
MEVSGQLHALATLPTEKGLLTLIVQEAGWVPEPVWRLWSGDMVNETDYISQHIAVYAKNWGFQNAKQE